MPFYEYQCSQCGHLFEAMQKISEAPLKKCPECGKSALKKLISAPVFRLKGSGWYETDFKSDQDRKRNLAGAEAEPTDPAGSTSEKPKNDSKNDTSTPDKTESKPAAAALPESAGKSSAAPDKAGKTTDSPAKRRSAAPAKRTRSPARRARPARGRR